MRRGEIRLVDLAPAGGAGADKRRPAVIRVDAGLMTHRDAAIRLHLAL